MKKKLFVIAILILPGGFIILIFYLLRGLKNFFGKLLSGVRKNFFG